MESPLGSLCFLQKRDCLSAVSFSCICCFSKYSLGQRGEFRGGVLCSPSPVGPVRSARQSRADPNPRTASGVGTPLTTPVFHFLLLTREETTILSGCLY